MTDKIISADSAFICWTIDENSGRITNVSIHPDAALASGFECTAGAFYVDWLDGKAAMTPEGVYVEMEAHGFHSPGCRIQALEEFARIEGYPFFGRMALDARELLDA